MTSGFIDVFTMEKIRKYMLPDIVEWWGRPLSVSWNDRVIRIL